MFKKRAGLITNAKLGEDPLVDEILSAPEGSSGQLYVKALALHKNKLKKGYIESSLLCSTDLVQIASLLEMDINLLKLYHDIFFDVEGIDRLSKIDHIESLNDKSEAVLKMWAISHGLEFIKWRLGYRVTISPVEGLHDLFSTCIYKSKEAMFNNSSSESSKESVKWTKLSTDIARLLKLWVLDSSAAKKDLEIAIREVLPEFDGLDSLLEEDKLLESLTNSVQTSSDLQLDGTSIDSLNS